ncbi:MAG TPA: hypothetical protein PKW06_04780 [Cyclobacteriaceae bacterium]|nr:hypothetical protein [Cyclobacteriaceae bacterium]MCB9236711.1 hypothetical protein [Flammeovirgaceae bacterium]MCB0500754.1 hypothetical protein [Cyclobacteriaceae bacterium]MCO5272632.1 hypothetical protein [Cyclobacteriaceae bacterium]MCW5901990.1 hypothetical protein [Cyclobacteriaceae bacterium]
MKSSLKEFIDGNREAFDDKAPRANTWGSILARLPGGKGVPLWHSVVAWRAAAMLLLALSVFLLIGRGGEGAGKASAKTSDMQLQGEFKDVESFYKGEIAKKVALIDGLGGPFESGQFTQDFEKLDAMYQVLRGQMNTRPSKEIRDALILNILVRIDLLNQQIERLEDLKKEKKKGASA